MARLRRWTSGETASLTGHSIPHRCRFNMRAPVQSTSTATGAPARYSMRRMPQSHSAAMPTGMARSSATPYTQREALIAASVHAMEIITRDHQPTARSKPRPMAKSEAAAYRRKYLGALARHEKWSVGEALDFQRDFQIYEELMARSASGRRRKPYEAANHPFVDRGAFLLDASFLEKARVAASRALISLEELTEQVGSTLK